jgi:hypothetical protein
MTVRPFLIWAQIWENVVKILLIILGLQPYGVKKFKFSSQVGKIGLFSQVQRPPGKISQPLHADRLLAVSMSSATPSGGTLPPLLAQVILLEQLLFSDSDDEDSGMPFIDEDSKEEIASAVKQQRTVYSCDYMSSEWARMLSSPGVSNPEDKDGCFFQRWFRVPYPVFTLLLERWFPEHDKKTDFTGRPLPPLELLVLGMLRVLGSGLPFDEVAELNNISAETNRRFFHKFCSKMAQMYPKWIYPPTTEAQIQKVMGMYSVRGFPGCIGSVDCVHIPWDLCPAMLRSLYCNGKEKYPTI